MDPNFLRTIFVGLNLIWIINLTHSAEGLNVTMNRTDEGARSIDSHVTVMSRVSNGNGGEKILLYVQFYGESLERYAYISYHDLKLDPAITLYRNISHLNLSVSTADDYTRIVTWKFSKLPANYTKLLLRTSAFDSSGSGTSNDQLNLKVFACDSLEWKQAFNQNATYNITADSNGHYNDNGTCECNNGGTLFYPDGDLAKTQATCGLYANWSGCEDIQCWTAPQVIKVSQINTTVKASEPFECNFTQGFPNANEVLFKVNNVTLPSTYTLQSSDDGKNLSCEVVSNYTKKTGNTEESTLQKITVYFSPENASLSNDTIMIPLNGTQELLFSFYANPREGNISTYVKVLSSVNAVPVDGLFNWTNDVTQIGDTTQYGRVLELNLASADETQTYAVCANCSSPEGEACAKLTLNAGNPNSEEGISTGIIIAVAVGVLALLVIVAVVCFIRRNHGNIKDERINAIYEATPGPGPPIENVYTETGENSWSEMTTNVAHEESPHQSEIQDIYTTVNREDKKKGRKEKDETKNGSAAATSAEENDPADVYDMAEN